jgi:hypothetical protein
MRPVKNLKKLIVALFLTLVAISVSIVVNPVGLLRAAALPRQCGHHRAA